MSRQEFVSALEKSLKEFQAGEDQVKAATREYAEVIDHPSDLGVLYQLNTRGVLGFSLAREWMQNVVNFQEGKPYLEPVPWDRLYSPYPYAPAPSAGGTTDLLGQDLAGGIAGLEESNLCHPD